MNKITIIFIILFSISLQAVAQKEEALADKEALADIKNKFSIINSEKENYKKIIFYDIFDTGIKIMVKNEFARLDITECVMNQDLSISGTTTFYFDEKYKALRMVKTENYDVVEAADYSFSEYYFWNKEIFFSYHYSSFRLPA